MLGKIGESEQGRPILGAVLGRGPRTVSLLAGAHAEEPVGPAMLRRFVRDCPAGWLDRYRFLVVPHVNPDGEEANRGWLERWPDPQAFRLGHVREPPGRDVEFAYPGRRPENRAVAAFLEPHAPFSLHVSFHGMAVATGALLLIERTWAGRTQELRDGFAAAAREAGLSLHDQNRKGEKGFFYIEPGFWTTPESAAMRSHFEARGDPETAARFGLNSMEFVRGLGGDPLCLVTEIPLWVAEEIGETDPAKLSPVDFETAIALQRRVLELGLRCVAPAR